MTRVIHTGDTHIGYQQYHVPERRADFLGAFRRVVEDAIAEDVDAVVHAGDLFHDRRPTLTDVLGTLEVLELLDDEDIPFLAVVGNHEAKRDAQWLDLYESLGLATRLDGEPYVVDDTAFYGLDFVPRSQREDLNYEFEPRDADHAALVTHGQFKPFEYGTWDAQTVIDEATVEFDALLLGDEHEAGTKQLGETWVTYCGSTERASADEREDRGYNIVTFGDDVQITRRGIDTRPFVFVQVELTADEGIDRVRERVGEYELEDAVVIVHVDGDGDPITPAGIEEYAQEKGALVARVTDHREFADEREVEVSFADPDDAVRERVRELGLSEVARDIDETIRASKVADSNVADEVQSDVAGRVEAGDLDVFDPAPDDSDTDSETASDDPEDDDAPASAADDGNDPSADASSPENATPDSESTEDSPSDESSVEGTPSRESPPEGAQVNGEPADGPEDQSTMGEYL